MSCFTKTIWEDKYYCIDDFFWSHKYWYVKMTEEEKESEEPWNLLDFTDLKWRGWEREVLKSIK